MRYKVISVFTAGVLSVMLIFTLLSSFGGFSYNRFGLNDVNSEVSDTTAPCSMCASGCETPFTNTTIMSEVNSEITEQNKYFCVMLMILVCISRVMSGVIKSKLIIKTDKCCEYLVRLLI